MENDETTPPVPKATKLTRVNRARKIKTIPTLDLATKDELIAELGKRVAHLVVVAKQDATAPDDMEEQEEHIVRATPDLGEAFKLLNIAAATLKIQVFANQNGGVSVGVVKPGE